MSVLISHEMSVLETTILHSVFFPLDYLTAIKVADCDTGCNDNAGMSITRALFYCVVFLFHFAYRQKPNTYNFPPHKLFKGQAH